MVVAGRLFASLVATTARFLLAFHPAPALNTAMAEKTSKVFTRVAYGSVMILALAALLYMDWWIEDSFSRAAADRQLYQSPLYMLPTTLLLAGLCVAAFRELDKLSRVGDLRLLRVSGLITTIVMATIPYWDRAFYALGMELGFDPISAMPMLLLAFGLIGMFVEQMIRYRTENALRRLGATLLAAVYLGVCGSVVLAIRQRSVSLLVLFLVSVKFTDIGAYFTGVAIGRHKMIPWLSPGKSWEGLVGGLAVTIAVSLAVKAALGIEMLEYWQVVVFAGVCGLAGQFADLCESLLKRSAGAKDSGAVVPAFGGVLDIIDSPLLAAPVASAALAILT